MPTTKTSRRVAAFLLAAPLALALAACGTAGSDDGQAPTPAPQTSDAQTFDTFEEYQLAFAACMREKGVDMPDPSEGGQSITQADDAFLEAAETCQREIGAAPAREGGSGTGGDSADTLREQHLEIAECLRDHGVDVPDPAPGEDLAVPGDVPVDVFETCAPQGVVGSTS